MSSRKESVRDRQNSAGSNKVLVSPFRPIRRQFQWDCLSVAAKVSHHAAIKNTQAVFHRAGKVDGFLSQPASAFAIFPPPCGPPACRLSMPDFVHCLNVHVAHTERMKASTFENFPIQRQKQQTSHRLRFWFAKPFHFHLWPKKGKCSPTVRFLARKFPGTRCTNKVYMDNPTSEYSSAARND